MDAFDNEKLQSQIDILRERRERIDEIKNDPAELEKCMADPLYFYNTYVALNGEVFTQEGYEEEIKKTAKLRNEFAVKPNSFPLTIDEAY